MLKVFIYINTELEFKPRSIHMRFQCGIHNIVCYDNLVIKSHLNFGPGVFLLFKVLNMFLFACFLL